MPTVAFDALGTLLSLGAPRVALRDAGAPSHATELWFAQSLRDAFALAHAGGYRPFAEILEAELPRTLRTVGIRPDARLMEAPLRSLHRLSGARGAASATASLREVGVRVLVVTNGSERSTERMLRRAGIAYDELISCDELRTTKPDPRVYDAVRARAIGETWLVAAHAWDCMGAARAGLKTAWISDLEREWLSAYDRPDLEVPDLTSAVTAVLAELTRCEIPETGVELEPPV